MLISESQLQKKVYAITEAILKEFDRDDYDEDYNNENTANAEEDFFDSGCNTELEQRYPDMSLDFEVSQGGFVKVIDLDTGKYYTGQGEVEYDTTGLGHSSSYDSYSEAEGEYEYYDFLNCLKTIMKKIDEGKADGTEPGYDDAN